MTEQDLAPNTTEAEEELTPAEELQKKLKEAIQVAIEDLGPLRKKMTITVPRETVDEQLHEQFDELRQEAQVPGFRKGRAPQKLLERRFGREVGEQVGSSLVGNSYLAAVDKEEIDPLGDPLVFVTVPEKRTDDEGRRTTADVEKLLPVEEALEHLKLPKEGDFCFACEIELKPKFELPSLEKIPVSKPRLTVTDDKVNAEIERLMQLRGTYRPVEGGKVEADDLVVGNARLLIDGESVETEENATLAARDQRYSGIPLEGFGTAVIGKQVDAKVSVDAPVPDDHAQVDWRGKKATFELTILDVKRLEVPKLDEEFAKTIGFESVDEFRTYLREGLEQRLEAEVRRGMLAQIDEYLLKNTPMEVPDKTSRRQAELIVARQMMDMYRRGVPDAEIKKMADALQPAAAVQAVEDLKQFFIMEKIAEDRDISATEEELNAAIAEIAQMRNQRFDRVRDEIISSRQLNTLYLRIRDEKILQALLADADVTETEAPAPAEKPAKKAPAKKKEAKDK